MMNSKETDTGGSTHLAYLTKVLGEALTLLEFPSEDVKAHKRRAHEATYTLLLRFDISRMPRSRALLAAGYLSLALEALAAAGPECKITREGLHRLLGARDYALRAAEAVTRQTSDTKGAAE